MIITLSAGKFTTAKQELDSILDMHSPALLYFRAPCETSMNSIVNDLGAIEYKECITIVCIDLDKHSEIAECYNVTGLPSFVMIKDEQEVKRKLGDCSRCELEKMIEEFLP
jgi:thioredoxin-like negative regulator of GroEL